jgi:hypothetical protein
MSEPLDGQLVAFPPPVNAVSVNAYYDKAEGWALVARTRREGAGWSTEQRYDRMLRPELVDVLLSVVIELLELADQR